MYTHNKYRLIQDCDQGLGRYGGCPELRLVCDKPKKAAFNRDPPYIGLPYNDRNCKGVPNRLDPP